MNRILSELNEKYHFNASKISEDSGVSRMTVLAFLHGDVRRVKSAKAIIDALPINDAEREELAKSIFLQEGDK